MRYVYESHLGGYYITSYIKTPTPYYCEKCGKCDYLVAEFKTLDEAWEYMDKMNKEWYGENS